MAQKVTGIIKLQINAAKATASPPVGPALGQHGVNIAAFIKEFNARTKDMEGYKIPVVITVYADRSFTFITKTPPTPMLIMKAIGLEKGSGVPNKTKVGKITREQLAAVLYRYAGKVGMDVTARADLKLFPDAGSVSAYATDALSWCVANGIVNGTLEHGTAYLDPQGSATRAQVATLMSRYLKLTEA